VADEQQAVSPGTRVARSLSRLPPDWLGAVLLLVLLLPLYLWSIDIRASRGAEITGDEPFYLMSTRSLLDDGDLDLRNQFEQESYEEFFDHPTGLWQQSVPLDDGTILSPHNPGLSVLLMPGLAAGGLLGAQLQIVAIGLATWVLAYVLTARLTGTWLLSWLATATVAVTATAFIYASEIYPEIPAALALLIALLVVTRDRRTGAAGGLVVLATMTIMLWLGTKYAPLAALIALFALWRGTSNARLAIVIGGGLSALLYGWFHLHTFGGLTPYAVNIVYAGESTPEIVESHLNIPRRFYRLWGLLIDRRFGVARWAPVLLLVPLGVLWMTIGDARHRLVAALIGGQVLVASFVVITMMGWWFPGRTLATVFPLFPIALVLAVRHGGRALRGIAIALAAYSLAITLLLGRAGHSREITIAVDPFDMGARAFSAVSPIFPQYTAWGSDTWMLTALWLTPPISLFARWLWPRRPRQRPTISSLVRQARRPL
jgi:hypothetical protein